MSIRFPIEKDCISPYLLKLSLRRIELMAPAELSLETGRLLNLLIERPEGLLKEELLNAFYPHFQTASATRQLSLRGSLNKVLQRARGRMGRFGIGIEFCTHSNRWKAIPTKLQN